MDIAKVFSFAFPEQKFSCGDSYESLTVFDGEKPSLEELQAVYDDYLLAESKKNLPSMVASFFENAIKLYSEALTPAERFQIYQVEAVCIKAFERGDFQAGAEGIKTLAVPEELEPVKHQILEMIEV